MGYSGGYSIACHLEILPGLLKRSYERYWGLTDLFPIYSSGMNTLHDKFVISFDKEELCQMIEDATNSNLSNEEFRQRYQVKDSRDWKLVEFRKQVKDKKGTDFYKYIRTCLYRPFDKRWIILHDDFVGYPRWETTRNFLTSNSLGLATTRQTVREISFLTSRIPFGQHKIVDPYDRSYIFPLYLYPTEDAAKQKSLLDVSPWPADEAHGGRVPNLNPKFVVQMARKLGLTFKSDLPACANPSGPEFGPEDVFHYIYAIFHSPTYRERYAEFLKIDFPRVPLTSDVELFRALCALGRQLVGLHLLESPEIGHFITRYPVAGENLVDKGYPKYTPPKQDQPGRVNINNTQYFEGVPPEVWEFYIGGYQVLHKWLKDRRGRQLSYDDLTHYQRVVVALCRTLDLMERIDETIPEWPIH